MEAPIDKTPVREGRRSFLVLAAGAGTALVAATASGCEGTNPNDRQLQFASLDDAMDELARLAQASELSSGAAWSWLQTLIHCAQSVEYSVSGFPQARSALFQRTVGSAAYQVFAWRGRMSHDLAEPIPGAPSLEAGGDAVATVARLRDAVQAFRQSAGPFKPHFAYGVLSKAEYEVAHAMHLANHFSAFRAKV